jgi:hypothetical protein
MGKEGGDWRREAGEGRLASSEPRFPAFIIKWLSTDDADLDRIGQEGGEERESWDELDTFDDLRAHMESRYGDCDIIIKECDALLQETRDMDSKFEKRASQK